MTLNSEIMIPENDPVRLLSAQLEELEYGKLYEAYSSVGRKWAADTRVMFKVLVHGYMCGIYSSRDLEEACRKRIDFMWLLEDERVPDHSTFARFRTSRTREAIEDLFYQFVRKLECDGETDHETVFIDGTKLEREHGARYASVTADAGYERLENYLYLEENGQMSFIKPKDYEQKKKKSFTLQIGRRENMTYLLRWGLRVMHTFPHFSLLALVIPLFFQHLPVKKARCIICVLQRALF